MKVFVDNLFKNASPADKRHILATLKDLGIDRPEDLRLLREADVADKLKLIHVRKLMEAVKQGFDDKHSEATPPLQSKPASSSDNLPDKTTRNLAIATGILGGVGAAAVPLAIFAALFPPITLPIAVAAGIGAGAVAAATAGTGIATAVRLNMDPDTFTEDAEEGGHGEGKEQGQEGVQDDDSLKKLL